MKSSTGAYFIALDHARAFAIFLVFYWHFNTINNGHLAPPFAFVPSIFTEGHTGVAVFMTLSGYLFAKILDGKNVDFIKFIWNRCIRLLPLLLIVILAVGIEKYFRGEILFEYIVRVLKGPLYPTLPNGGWSITVEFHFYVLLPFIIWMARKSNAWLFLAVAVAVAVRLAFFLKFGSIQYYAYWTILGKFDDFALGILAFNLRHMMTRNHVVAGLTLIGFLLYYRWFDSMGGFYKFGVFPSKSPIWIIMSTIEGAAYATIIAWYDTSFRHPTGLVSRFIARIGEASYSLYLLHYFFVYRMAEFVNRYVMLVDPAPRFLSTVICFLLVVPIAMLSYKFIESPFLKYRVKYIKDTRRQTATIPAE